eukprot:TRINITY_DN62362_c0_g1_i1.p1 TRINITY_DN62362_c0_g1~~TRINITY_DN62362_c0_g1_i1.p1  ORF type:complete len:340 (-),score=61.77 TRINITY_DN62362_c0_g1_i1:45-1064(-)
MSRASLLLLPWLMLLAVADEESQLDAAAGHEGSCEAEAERASPAAGQVTRRSRRARHVLEGPKPIIDGGGSWRLVLKEDSTATGAWSGNKVWPGALALLGHLHETWGRQGSKGLSGIRVLELGCGLPLVAGSLAALGAEVCATDHPRVLPKAEAAATSEERLLEGLSEAALQRLQFRPLAWGRGLQTGNLSELCGFDGPVDLVVGADLVYDGFPVDALHETISDALVDHGATAVLALQPRLFPMAAALKEPRLVKSFLQRFAQKGSEWGVTAAPAGSDALGADQQPPLPDGQAASKGLVITTVTGPSARRSPPVQADGWHPIRYERQDLNASSADGRAA